MVARTRRPPSAPYSSKYFHWCCTELRKEWWVLHSSYSVHLVLMMNSLEPGCAQFEFENCKFVIQRAKEGTGRVVMKQLGVLHSYTLEASVCGTLIGSNSTQVQTHFNSADLKEMGEIFCQTIAEFFDQNPVRVRFFYCPSNHHTVKSINSHHYVSISTELECKKTRTLNP